MSPIRSCRDPCAKLCFNPTFLRMPILLVCGHVTSLPGLKLGSEQQTVALQQSFPNNFPWAASHANTCTNSLDTHATYPPSPSIPSNTNPSFSQIIYKFKAWPADRPGWAKAMKLWITLSTIQIMKMEQAVLCFVMLSTCNSE